MAAVGAYYILSNFDIEYGKLFVRTAVIIGVIAAFLQLYPTGDGQGVMIVKHQPTTLAAIEGVFHSRQNAPIAILGQPDVQNQRLDNPLLIPGALSFLTYRSWTARVPGLDEFPRSDWPDNIELLYFAYHIMVGLGTLFIAILFVAAWQLFRGTLLGSKPMLWTLMLAMPFPFIANTAGWITAEVGRQPWLVYGMMRTKEGFSPLVSAGSVWFTLLGFFGMYSVLSILFLFLVHQVIAAGPADRRTDNVNLTAGQLAD
jgi:cytochrome d ubiquinol oxidase subunit I